MGGDVVLVRDGVGEFCLQVWPPQDAEAIRGAVEELVEHLECCLGGPVCWWDRDPVGVLPAVRLVLNYDPMAELSRDGFCVEVCEGEVKLTAASPVGMRHSVAELLESVFGVRWLWPGPEGTVTPRAVDCTVPMGRRVVEPDWLWRRLWTGGAFWREDDAYLAEHKVSKLSPASFRTLKSWQERQRLEGVVIADGHRWSQICSPLDYGESHPEYFALIDGERDSVFFNGKHRNQPCTSNPGVIAVTAEHLKAQFRARPELDGFSLSVNDGLGFCECELCQRQDEAIFADAGVSSLDETTNEDGREGGSGKPITDRMIRFANAVAEQVVEEFPEKILMFLIYSVYRTPPVATVMHPNILAQFCIRTWANVDRELYEGELATMAKLGESASKLGIYDYYVNGIVGCVPRGFSRIAHESLQAYHARGYRYFATQTGQDFATNGFTYYLTAKMLWDVNGDFEALLDDYCSSGFGPAAEAVKRYIVAFTEKWESEGISSAEGPLRLAKRLYPPRWLRARKAELSEALALVKGQQDYVLRVKFLRAGLRYLELFRAASVAALRLESMGMQVDAARGQDLDGWLAATEDWCEAQSDQTLLVRAVTARRRLLDWTEAHGDGFWFGRLWFEYSRLHRKRMLGQVMDVVESHVKSS